MKTFYVVGFYFNEDFSKVALIEKKRPKWQVDKLNGIGGHIEKGEQPIDSMVREFKEETGVITSEYDWIPLAEISNDNWKVFFFYANGNIEKCESKTDERIVIINTIDIFKENVIPNLRWLIPMCIDEFHDYCIATAKN